MSAWRSGRWILQHVKLEHLNDDQIKILLVKSELTRARSKEVIWSTLGSFTVAVVNMVFSEVDECSEE